MPNAEFRGGSEADEDEDHKKEKQEWENWKEKRSLVRVGTYVIHHFSAEAAVTGIAYSFS